MRHATSAETRAPMLAGLVAVVLLWALVLALAL